TRRSSSRHRQIILVFHGADIDGAMDDAGKAALIHERCAAIVPRVNDRATRRGHLRLRGSAVILQRAELRVDRVGAGAHLVALGGEVQTARSISDEVVAETDKGAVYVGIG